MANSVTILIVFISFLMIISVLYVFPQLEGIFIYTGAGIENATGYAVDQGPAHTAQAVLWGSMAVLVTIAGFIVVFDKSRGG